MKAIKIISLQFFFVCSLLFSAAYTEELPDTEEDIFLYKAIPGDSLWNIAQRHLRNIKLWTDLKVINGLPNDDYIEPGTLIKVPRMWLKTNQTSATLINAIGNVQIINQEKQTLEYGKDFTEYNNLILFTGDIVITGDDGLATILFKDGSRLFLQSNSELVMKDLIALGDGSLSDIKLQLDKGRLENRVYSSPISNTNYEVKTQTMTTSVRGTTFRVGLDESGSVTEVVAGKVIATSANNNESSTELEAGQAVLVSNDGIVDQVAMLPPPEFSNFPQLIESVPIHISVEPIEGVTGYSTKIIPVGNDLQDVVSSIRSDDNVLLGTDLSDGRYQMVVSAIDDKGVTGRPALYEFILNARPFAASQATPNPTEKVLLRNLVFSWNKANDDAKAYYLQVAKDAQFRDIVIDADNLSDSRYAPEALLSGIYFWRIASIDEEGQRGPFSEGQEFRILLEDPTLNKADIKLVAVHLKWAPLEEGTQYLIQISDAINFNNILFEQSLLENSLDVEGLKPGTYYFRIQSTAKDGYVSEWGLPHQFEVLDIQAISEKIKQ